MNPILTHLLFYLAGLSTLPIAILALVALDHTLDELAK